MGRQKLTLLLLVNGWAERVERRQDKGKYRFAFVVAVATEAAMLCGGALLCRGG